MEMDDRCAEIINIASTSQRDNQYRARLEGCAAHSWLSQSNHMIVSYYQCVPCNDLSRMPVGVK